ncbi:MAG: (d)CMP kinase [Patescibacteria group bacterium]
MKKKILTLIIAIDGPEASGKGELAYALSQKLKILRIDSGAIYRAVAVYCLKNKISCSIEKDVIGSLSKIEIFQTPSTQLNRKVDVFLNGEDVSEDIRTSDASKFSAVVARYSEVRDFVTKIQRKIALSQDVVNEGRDIGTVVFPDATIKIFLTADILTRAKRRLEDYLRKGENKNLDDVIKMIQERDALDFTNLAYGGMRPADGAIVIDTSDKSVDDEVKIIEELLKSEHFLNLGKFFKKVLER